MRRDGKRETPHAPRTAQSPERRSTEGAAFGFACAMWGCRCAILLLYGEVVLSRSPGYQAPGATQPEVRVNARRAAPLGRCSRSGSWSVQISSRPDGKTAPVDSAFCFWPRQRRQPSLLGGAAGWCPPPPPRSLRRLGSARRGEGRPPSLRPPPLSSRSKYMVRLDSLGLSDSDNEDSPAPAPKAAHKSSGKAVVRTPARAPVLHDTSPTSEADDDEHGTLLANVMDQLSKRCGARAHATRVLPRVPTPTLGCAGRATPAS